MAFSIYDTDGIGQMDASVLGELLRACDLNPTNALVEKFGGTKKKGRWHRERTRLTKIVKT